jgi:hypothetical protein
MIFYVTIVSKEASCCNPAACGKKINNSTKQ